MFTCRGAVISRHCYSATTPSFIAQRQSRSSLSRYCNKSFHNRQNALTTSSRRSPGGVSPLKQFQTTVSIQRTTQQQRRRFVSDNTSHNDYYKNHGNKFRGMNGAVMIGAVTTLIGGYAFSKTQCAGGQDDASSTAVDPNDANTLATSSAVTPKENLFVELRDMAEVSFLIYSYAYLVAAAKVLQENNADEFDLNGTLFNLCSCLDKDGNDVSTEEKCKMAKLAVPTIHDDKGNALSKEDAKKVTKTKQMMTTTTPAVLYKLVDDHKTVIKEYQEKGKIPKSLNVDAVLKSLEEMKNRVPSNNPNALTLVTYDDAFQDSELVYAIGKDDVNKRITVSFRGTENSKLLGSFGYNWMTNFSIAKEKVQPLPSKLQNYLDHATDNTDGGKIDRVWLHSGFYNKGVMAKTQLPTDPDDTTKYDQVLRSVKYALKENPGYELYVTGHSLGAAVSTVFAFFFACEPDNEIPKPVMNCNFASPRVGDSFFLRACQELEQQNQLRIFRVVNDKDSVTVAPTVNYSHVGFQLKLPRPSSWFRTVLPPPELTYPTRNGSYGGWFSRAWDNSALASFNLAYDHSDYRERILAQQDHIQAFPPINELYRKEKDLLGFEISR